MADDGMNPLRPHDDGRETPAGAGEWPEPWRN
jgi:hypothetical protein